MLPWRRESLVASLAYSLGLRAEREENETSTTKRKILHEKVYKPFDLPRCVVNVKESPLLEKTSSKRSRTQNRSKKISLTIDSSVRGRNKARYDLKISQAASLKS